MSLKARVARITRDFGTVRGKCVTIFPSFSGQEPIQWHGAANLALARGRECVAKARA